MARERRLSPEEIALMRAQTQAIPEELRQKAAIAARQAQIEEAKNLMLRDIEREKLGFGREELGVKERDAQTDAAIKALMAGSTESLGRANVSADVVGDLSRRGDITPGVLGEAMAEEGHPGLYNAFAREKAGKREKLISQMTPQTLGARSDEEREKNIRPLMTEFPGAYEEMNARAFPKPGVTPNPSKPELWSGGGVGAPVANNAAGGYGALAETLLGKAGINTKVGGGRQFAPNGYPILSPTEIEGPRNYPLGEKPLYGSTRTEGGIRTPSGGFIGGEFSDERLARLTGQPQQTQQATVPVNPTQAGNVGVTPAFSGLPVTTGYQQPTNAFVPPNPMSAPTPAPGPENLPIAYVGPFAPGQRLVPQRPAPVPTPRPNYIVGGY